MKLFRHRLICRSRREETHFNLYGDQSLLTSTPTRKNCNGSVLIIVLWVAFGLIALTLYFANSMSFELRASDNRAAMIEADQAIIGAARYVSNVIATVREPATLPDINNYRSEQVPVGDATFWLIGRADRQTAMDQVFTVSWMNPRSST